MPVFNMDEARRFLRDEVIPFSDQFGCQHDNMALLHLLTAIWFELRGLATSFNFGATRFDVHPVTFETNSKRILEKSRDGKVRKVAIWLDSAVGGPTPTIRVSKGGSTGGFRINAGTVNDIGEIAPDIELWATSTANINGHVIERA